MAVRWKMLGYGLCCLLSAALYGSVPTTNANAQDYNGRRQGLLLESVKRTSVPSGPDIVHVLYYNAPDQNPNAPVSLQNVRVWILASNRWLLLSTEYSNSNEDFAAGDFYGKPLRSNVVRARGTVAGKCQTIWVEGTNPWTNRIEWDAMPCPW